MEVCNPKGGRTAAPAFPAMLLLMMMLLNAYCCGAAVVAKSNTSFRCSHGRLDECLIEEDLELELEFLMNPYVSRILTGGDGTSQINPDDPNHQAIPCGKPSTGNPAYDSCIAKLKKDNKACHKKDTYTRCGQSP